MVTMLFHKFYKKKNYIMGDSSKLHISGSCVRWHSSHIHLTVSHSSHMGINDGGKLKCIKNGIKSSSIKIHKLVPKLFKEGIPTHGHNLFSLG
jgi:hypothetical protein